MILLFIFLSIWLGFAFKWSIIPIIGIYLFLSLFIFKKIGAKRYFICFGIFLSCIGISYINLSKQQESYKGIVIESKENYFLFSSNMATYYVKEKENEYEIGDILKIDGKAEKLDFITIESQFDFQEYLNKKNVIYEIKTHEINYIFANKIRINKSRKAFLDNFEDDTAKTISSILFSTSLNGNDYLSESNLNLGRLLSSSGLYIYAYIKVITFIIQLISKKKFKYGEDIAIALLIPYFIFTFPKFCILKILLIYLLKKINLFKKSPLDHSSIVYLSGILFLLVNPTYAVQDSFVLTYGTSSFNMMLRPSLNGLKSYKQKMLSIAFMFLFFLPFEIKYHNGFSLLSPLIVAVLSPLFVTLGFTSLLCFYKLPLYKPIEFLYSLMNKSVHFLSKFSLFIPTPRLSKFLVLIYYSLLILYVLFKLIKFKPVKKIVGFSLFSFLFLYSIPIQNCITTSVSFINVGQGDSCLIRKGNTTIMIDTGGLTYQDISTSCLIPYLHKNRISKIDLLITTHDDFDHSGGVESLMNHFKVGMYVNSSRQFPIDVNGLVLNNYNTHTTDYSEENKTSLVIGFKLSEVSYLITGDADKTIENHIMEEYPSLECDVLKVGHHGSNSSSSNKFIQFLSPKEAVISVGRNNKYKHPNKEVLEILNKNKVLIRRTDIEGTITYKKYIFV